MFNGNIHYKLPFSIAMLVHQRVCHVVNPSPKSSPAEGLSRCPATTPAPHRSPRGPGRRSRRGVRWAERQRLVRWPPWQSGGKIHGKIHGNPIKNGGLHGKIIEKMGGLCRSCSIAESMEDSSSKIAKSGKIGGTSMAMWPLKTCHFQGLGSLAATKPWDALQEMQQPILVVLGGSPRL